VSAPGQPITAVMSRHARERAAEMGICTKRIKRMLRNPSVNHVTRDNRFIAMSTAEPTIAVVYAIEDGQPTVVTVLWRSEVRYDRATFRPQA
jgi:hypothetical protein